jgi:hypothetical protein
MIVKHGVEETGKILLYDIFKKNVIIFEKHFSNHEIDALNVRYLK